MNKKKWQFTSDDKEWHQTLINVFSTFLNLTVKPVLVYDRKQFTKYLYGNGKWNANEVWAECVKETGMIWLSPHLSSEPKIETINTIYHELLHIKHPKWNENKIRMTVDSLIPVTQSQTSKKKKFDHIYRRAIEDVT